MATSTYPAARTNLLSLLQAAPGLAGILVVDGAPMVDEPEFVSVLNGTGSQQKAVMGTNHPRDEAYDVFVLVATTNSDPADALTPLDRAFTLMAAVETALRTDPSLAGAVRVAELDKWDLDELQGVEARGCNLLLTVHCEARI